MAEVHNVPVSDSNLMCMFKGDEVSQQFMLRGRHNGQRPDL